MILSGIGLSEEEQALLKGLLFKILQYRTNDPIRLISISRRSSKILDYLSTCIEDLIGVNPLRDRAGRAKKDTLYALSIISYISTNRFNVPKGDIGAYFSHHRSTVDYWIKSYKKKLISDGEQRRLFEKIIDNIDLSVIANMDKENLSV